MCSLYHHMFFGEDGYNEIVAEVHHDGTDCTLGTHGGWLGDNIYHISEGVGCGQPWPVPPNWTLDDWKPGDHVYIVDNEIKNLDRNNEKVFIKNGC